MNEVRIYRKKPVTVEAIQWDGTIAGLLIIQRWNSNVRTITDVDGVLWLLVDTLEAKAMGARANDWIIKGVKGEFYPCRCDIFSMTYEIAPGGTEEA